MNFSKRLGTAIGKLIMSPINLTIGLVSGVAGTVAGAINEIQRQAYGLYNQFAGGNNGNTNPENHQ